MHQKKDIEAILEKARKIFIWEAREKLNNNFASFLNYYMSKNDNDRFSIENFFHSIKGMSSMSGFHELEKEASIMEQFMAAQKNKDTITPDDILKIFNGYAKVLEHINFLSQTYLSDALEESSNEETACNIVMSNNSPSNSDNMAKDPMTDLYFSDSLCKDFYNYSSNIDNRELMFSIALINIDQVEVSNIENNYNIKETTLKDFAEFLKKSAPAGTLIYRFESDMFILAFTETDSPEAYYHLLGMIDQSKNLSFSSAIYTIKNPDENIENTIADLYETLKNSQSLGYDKISVINSKNPQNTKKPKILIIEDLSITAYMIRKYLNKYADQIYHSADGIDGLKKANEIIPDIILLDLMLPKLDGFELCKMLKSNPLLENSKIIVISSKNSAEDVFKCFQMGIDDFIPKPFSINVLTERINRLL